MMMELEDKHNCEQYIAVYISTVWIEKCDFSSAVFTETLTLVAP